MLDGSVPVICCTNAFGMGIDKKNVHFVIHLTQPSSLEDYVQESGPGGRNGETCNCTLLYRFADRTFHLQNTSKIESKQVTDDKLRMLNEISKFCVETYMCTVQSIARHFGEDESNPCGVCDIC